MPADKKRQNIIVSAVGIIPVIWLALMCAPAVSGGLTEIVRQLGEAFEHPFRIHFCSDSLKTVLIFLMAYAMGIGVYFSSQYNYRKREEHGSAKWGDSRAICKKYRSADPFASKLLTQNVRIGLNGRVHRRNLNVLIVGGSGAGKTRFYAKPSAPVRAV